MSTPATTGLLDRVTQARSPGGFQWERSGMTDSTAGIGERNGKKWEKDTKSHQQRRIALDEETDRRVEEPWCSAVPFGRFADLPFG
jgi:hypothetical protein